MIVDALIHEDAADRVRAVSLTASAPLKAAGAHGALLGEGGGEASLAQSGEGPDSIVPENDNSVWLGQVHLQGCCCLQGEDSSPSFAPDLAPHVLGVREGANDNLALPVGPPAKNYAPSLQGGVPGDDHDAGGASLAGEEGRV